MGMRDDLVNLLISQQGYHEGRDPGGDWNNVQKFSEETPGLEWSDGQPWCAVFEAWGANKVGFADKWPMTASCAEAVSWWQAQGRLTEYPVLGGPLYMGDGGGSHTEVVWKFDADTVWSVGGNTNDNGSAEGDGVYLKQRPRRGPGSPTYYGVPDYPEGVISADPHWGGAADGEINQGNAPQADPASAQQDYAPFPGADFFYVGQSDDLITRMGKRLVEEGCSRYHVGPGPDWGRADQNSYAAWQVKCGYSGAGADGIPGQRSWDRLQVPAN
jgi:hypothetical protein